MELSDQLQAKLGLLEKEVPENRSWHERARALAHHLLRAHSYLEHHRNLQREIIRCIHHATKRQRLLVRNLLAEPGIPEEQRAYFNGFAAAPPDHWHYIWGTLQEAANKH